MLILCNAFQLLALVAMQEIPRNWLDIYGKPGVSESSLYRVSTYGLKVDTQPTGAKGPAYTNCLSV